MHLVSALYTSTSLRSWIVIPWKELIRIYNFLNSIFIKEASKNLSLIYVQGNSAAAVTGKSPSQNWWWVAVCQSAMCFYWERFPCKSGARGQGPNTMVKCELRTINESGHKLIEFLLDKQSGHSDTWIQHCTGREIEGVDSLMLFKREGMLVLSSTDSCQMPLSAQISSYCSKFNFH